MRWALTGAASFPGKLLFVLLGSVAFCSAVFSSSPLAGANALAQPQPPARATRRDSPRDGKENASAARPGARHFDRVLIIVLENADYEAAIRNKDMAALAAQGASFSNFHALFHPSYPNYLAMVAGTDFGIHRGGSYLGDRQRDFDNDAEHKTIADRLLAAGLDFKQYAEELPAGNCPWKISQERVPDGRGNYARKHVPFFSFREVQQKWCDRVIRVDSSNPNNYFAQDAKKGLVAYSFYSPNMNHDGHDTTLGVAAEWLKKFLDETFPEKLRHGTLVIVTFDEAGGNEDNRICTLFLGDMVKDASQQEASVLARHYTHYNVLRTIEDNFGLEPLTANDRDAEPITGIWK